MPSLLHTSPTTPLFVKSNCLHALPSVWMLPHLGHSCFRFLLNHFSSCHINQQDTTRQGPEPGVTLFIYLLSMDGVGDSCAFSCWDNKPGNGVRTLPSSGHQGSSSKALRVILPKLLFSEKGSYITQSGLTLSQKIILTF